MSFCDALLLRNELFCGESSCNDTFLVTFGEIYLLRMYLFVLQHVLKGKSKMDFLGLHLGNGSCLFSKAVRSIESSEVCIVALRDRCRFVLQRCTEKLHDCIAAEERGSFLPWVANLR